MFPLLRKSLFCPFTRNATKFPFPLQRLFQLVYTTFLAIAIIAALDSVFGGITGVLKGEFDFKVFISGFFCNAILSILLTYLGTKLNVDIYLAAIVVFVGRMFINLTIIRKYYIDKWSKNIERRRSEKNNRT